MPKTRTTRKLVDNSVYDATILDFQDQQQGQVAALREYYPMRDNPLNVRVVEASEPEPLEKSLVPFTKEAEDFMDMCSMFGQAAFSCRRVVVGNRLFLEY